MSRDRKDDEACLGKPPSLIYSSSAKVAGSKRRRLKRLPPTHRSLAVLVESLRCSRLVFELKNDTAMAGEVFDVDANLNVNLVDAELTLVDGRKRRLDDVYLNGSMILYVRFPPKTDPLRSLDTYLDARNRIARAGTRTKRPALDRSKAGPALPPIDLGSARPRAMDEDDAAPISD
mmetsp:Transcript_10751/g.35617  ORF Transcript_10751/g.35617 Transcript_10751/m.35617 type:complete len:176 (-) Transcript_10751:326-853(-)